MNLYNLFRRDYSLDSYKLDYVSGYFISDSIKKIDHPDNEEITIVYSKNLHGLENMNP